MTRPLVSSPGPEAPAPAGRLLFVDAARAAAVLFMIQGHALQVLLAPQYQANPVAHGWLFLRGLTSCAFFLLAGFSFSVATVRHWDDYRAPSRRLVRRFARYLAFWTLGYGLHLPVRSVVDLPRATPEQWQSFAVVDVLQLVAVTLAVLQIGVCLTRSRRRLAVGTLVVAASVVLATPVAWTANWTSAVPVMVASYVTGATGSLFPLFPWAAYIFLGASVGLWYADSGMVRRAVGGGWAVLGAGIGLLTAGVLMDAVAWTPYGPVDFWTVSPNLFLVKTGAVLIGLAVVIRVTGTRVRLPGVVTALSRESLLVYVAHLALLYRPIFGIAVVRAVGPRLGPWPVAASAVLLMGAMSALAWGWYQSRRHVAEVPDWLRAGLAAVVLLGLV